MLILGLPLWLGACADMSMYNQTPAPVGRPAEAPQPPETVQTWPLEPTEPQVMVPTEPSYQPSEPTMEGENPAVVSLLEGAEDNRRAQ